jgi:hypothetical protein
MKDTDLTALRTTTNAVAESAMKNIPADQRGTPYIVLVGKNGIKMELRGNIPYDDYPVQGSDKKQDGVKTIIGKMLAGTAVSDYKGDTTGYQEGDHIIGNPNAPIVMVEYSDLECPFCKKFGVTAKKIVDESNGQVAWVYRHWIVHPGALPKAGAAECVAKIKGNDAFWKYIDLVFGLVKTEEDVSGIEKL